VDVGSEARGVPIDPRTGLPVSVGYSYADSGLGYTMRALATWSRNFSATRTYRASAAYVTGSHASNSASGGSKARRASKRHRAGRTT